MRKYIFPINSSNQYYKEDYRDLSTYESDVILDDTISGSGGCFGAGTLVHTAHGFKTIEHCFFRTAILGYDKFGEIVFAQVQKLHVHQKLEFDDDLYFIKSGDKELFPFGVTGNHAVYDHTTNEHKEIKDFVIGENLTGFSGELFPITEITITPHDDLPSDFKVYNLTVDPTHTYFVGSEDTFIRVHNGGGKKGQGAGAYEAPNTLRANSVANVIDLISHGEIVGVNGGGDPRPGIYFDGTPLINNIGANNFGTLINILGTVTYIVPKIQTRLGTPSQTAMSGFSDVESIIFATPTNVTNGHPVIVSIPDANKQACKVALNFPNGLYKQDTTNGNLSGSSLWYTIETKAVTDSTWTMVVNKNLSGKTMSAYQVEYYIPAPATSLATPTILWSVRITRSSADILVASEKNDFQVFTVTEILEQVYTYPNMALVGLSVPAIDTNNSIPTRGYDVTGIKVQIPSNYNTALRTYAGASVNPGTGNPLTYTAPYWDGTFVTGWTDNPAWILYDLITNNDYGMGNYLGQAIAVDKWAFYNAALYNDCTVFNSATGQYTKTLISDGTTSGLEHRYLFNAAITTQQDAWQLLQAVASNMRALVVKKGNQVSIIQDTPKSVTKTFINSNVLNGIFAYSSTEVSSRTTSVNCTFNDINNHYMPKTISEWDSSAVAQYGYITKDIVAYGCVNESQARRMAKWALYTELHQTEMVNFSVGLNLVDMQIGDLIQIQDDDYISPTNQYLSGRVVSVTPGSTTTTIVLGNPLTLSAGLTYTFGVVNLDHTAIISGTVTTGAGTYTTITVNGVAAAGDYSNNEWYCYSSSADAPRQFIIQGITETQKGLYAVTGIFYDSQKFGVVELGLSFVPIPLPPSVISHDVPQPGTISFTPTFFSNGLISKNYIDITWNFTPSSKDTIYFNVQWRKDNGTFVLINNLASPEFTIDDTIPGVYEIWVWANNIFSQKSLPQTQTFNYFTAAGVSDLLPPTGLYVAGTTGTTFNTYDLQAIWSYNTGNDSITISNRLLDYWVEIWTADGATKKWIYEIKPDANKNGSGVYSYDRNKTDFTTVIRSFMIKVYSRDLMGNISATALTAVFNNPAPTAPTGTVTGYDKDVTLTVTSTIPSDATNIIVASSLTSGFTPSPSNFSQRLPATNNGNLIRVGAYTTYYFRVAISDGFDESSLNWSPEYYITTSAGATSLVFASPATPTGLTVTETFYTQPSGEKLVNILVSWTANTDRTSTYTFGYLNYSKGETTYSYIDTSTTSLTFSNIVAGDTYRYVLRANFGDAHSAFTSYASITTNGDTTPTGPCSALAVTNGLSSVTLSWVNPTDTDYAKTEIWYNTTNNRALSSAPVASITGTSYTFPDLPPGLSGYFWVRAVDTSGNLSTFYPASTTAGIMGTTSPFVNNSAPTNAPVFSSTSVSSQSSTGTVDITVNWTYSSGTIPADGFIIYSAQGTSPPTTANSGITISNPAARSYTFVGVSASVSYTAGVLAYRNASSGIQVTSLITGWSYTAGTANITANLNGTAAATVVSNASAGNTVAINTATFTNTGIPSNAPVFSSTSASSQSSIGTVDITITWTYTQGALPADGFVIYYSQGTTAPTTASTIGSTITDPSARSFTFVGVSAGTSYTAGVVAYRNTSAGVKKTAITTGWSYTAAVSNITANIAGVTASTVSTNVTATTNFATSSTPSNSPTIGAITATTATAAGLVDITINWSYTQGSIPADSFIIYYAQGTTNPTGSSPSISVNGNARSYTFVGVPADASYKVGIAAARLSSVGIQSGSLITAWTRTGVAVTIASSAVSGLGSFATLSNINATNYASYISAGAMSGVAFNHSSASGSSISVNITITHDGNPVLLFCSCLMQGNSGNTNGNGEDTATGTLSSSTSGTIVTGVMCAILSSGVTVPMTLPCYYEYALTAPTGTSATYTFTVTYSSTGNGTSGFVYSPSLSVFTLKR